MTKHYPVEQRERAVKMVLDHLDEYRSVYAACQAIGPKVEVGAGSLCRSTLQALIAASQVIGPKVGVGAEPRCAHRRSTT